MTKEMYKEKFNINLLRLIEEKGLSKCEFGIKVFGYDNRTYIYRILNDKTIPNCKTLVNIAKALGVSCSELADFGEDIE